MFHRIANFVCRWSSCLLVLALVTLTGCIPSHVAWTPDSAGFVFTERNASRLVHYHVATKMRRVIVEDTGTRTPWPAVSPDGTRVAVARQTKEMGSRTVTLVVLTHDIKTGKLLKESRAFQWEEKEAAKKSEVVATGLAWGDARHLVVATREDRCGIYDVDRDDLQHTQSKPFFPTNYLVRADRKGFLGYREPPNQELAFTFVDWEGKERQIGKPLADKDLVDNPLVEFFWDKDVACLGFGNRNRLRLDTENAVATLQKDGVPNLLPCEGRLAFVHAFPGTARHLCTFKHKGIGEGAEEFNRIEIHDLAAKKRTVLVEKCRVVSDFDPSPDGSMVALRMFTGGDRPDQILVISVQGKIVAEINVEP